MSKNKYPKVLFVKREGNEGDEFLVPYETADKAAEIGEVVEVAIYKLDRVAKVKTTTTTSVE